jgi:hypothetical protein
MDNFEEHLMKKYPDLFYTNEAGELECPCGVWVPQGWQTIIDELCGSIVNHTKHTYKIDRKIISKQYYLWNSIAKFLDWSHKRLYIKLFPQLNKWEYNKPFFSFVEKFRSRSYKCVKYYRVNPPGIKIDQIKEKFGGLRFYYSGVDEQIAGMVLFAEHLCNKTCEVSGEQGELCSNGHWYKTLAPKLREEEHYKSYKPTK